MTNILKGEVLRDVAIFNHQNKIVSWKKEYQKLPAKCFMIKGYPYIFEDSIDFKELYSQWGYKAPQKLSKQNKYDILSLTKGRHKEGSLNWIYWNYFTEKFIPAGLKNQMKLMNFNHAKKFMDL